MLIPTRTLSSLPLSVRLTAIMASVIEGTSIFFQSQITTKQSNLLIIGYIDISIPFILKIKNISTKEFHDKVRLVIWANSKI